MINNSSKIQFPQGNVINFNECEFIAGAAKIAALPVESLPEIAIIGKSNVGKSSLINLITSRKKMARVSHTPGRTRQINLFMIDQQFILADLPGYGYAKVSHKEQQQWEKLILYYLEKRSSLLRVFLLIDARRGIKDHDIEIIRLINDFGRNLTIILTKCDKVKKIELEQHKQLIYNYFKVNKIDEIEIIETSARSNNGAEKLRVSMGKQIFFGNS